MLSSIYRAHIETDFTEGLNQKIISSEVVSSHSSVNLEMDKMHCSLIYFLANTDIRDKKNSDIDWKILTHILQ